MEKTERTGEKYARITILRTTQQKLKELAGPDMTPGMYLDNIIDKLAEGNPAALSKPKLAEEKTSLQEVTVRLDALAKSIQWLTEITLANRQYIDTLKTTPAPPPGPAERYGPGFRKRDQDFEPPVPGREQTSFHFPAHDKHSFPMSPPPEAYENREEDESSHLEEKIKQWEKDNPW